VHSRKKGNKVETNKDKEGKKETRPHLPPVACHVEVCYNEII
jgi:hypothetical protein